MMEKLADAIAFKIAAELGYDDEKREILAYGLFGIMDTLITLVIVGTVSAVFGFFIEGMIICIVGSVLRKYSGGAHAPTVLACIITSVLVCSLGAVVSQYLTLLPPIPVGSILIVVCLLSLLLMVKYAPVDNPNKPIRKEEKRKALRKRSIQLAVLVFGTTLFAVIFSLMKQVSVPSAIAALTIGTIWQSLTLTPLFVKLLASS